MYTGQIISGVGHGALILWLLLGNFLFSPPEPEELSVVSGSLISSADFEAMQAAARASAATSPEPVVEEPPPEPVVEVPAPVPDPEPVIEEPPPEPVVEEPPPEPVIEEPPPEPEVVPEGQTGFAEPSPLPASDNPQPLPNPLADARPRPRPADIIRQVPVEPVPDVQVAETPTPAVSDVPTDQPVIEQPPAEEAAPEAAATELVPEQLEPVEQPTLAPTSSPRPRARPRVPEPAVEPAADPVTQEAPPETVEQTEPDQPAADPLADVLADVVNDASTEPPTEGGGTTRSLGEALNSAELNGLANTINRCWDLGAASTAATSVSITLLVTLDQGAIPVGVEVLETSGDTPEAIAIARRAAMRAVRDCGKSGLGLPPEKYETWKQIEIVFDPRGAQLR